MVNLNMWANTRIITFVILLGALFGGSLLIGDSCSRKNLEKKIFKEKEDLGIEFKLDTSCFDKEAFDIVKKQGIIYFREKDTLILNYFGGKYVLALPYKYK